jgi:flagellar basal body L-ring protein FlgH
MRYAFSLVFCVWTLFSFSACGGILQSLRDESDAIDREAELDRQYQQEVQAYRQRTLTGLSANNVQAYDPPAVRGYGRRLSSNELPVSGESLGGSRQAAQPGFRRVTRHDFVDNSPNENSLWDSQGQENFLFAHNRQRAPGDLITVDVERELRREIQFQLWMTLPPEQRRARRPASPEQPAEGQQAQGPDNRTAEERNKDAAEEAAKTNVTNSGKDDDIVRMEVAENIGNGIVRLVGQKRVIYRGVSRVVEVMALVNNKDVDDNNRMRSSAFLDMKTQVVQ